MQGFDLSARSFEQITDNKGLYRKIEIKNITVYIAGDRSAFEYGPYKIAASGVAGYANTNNEIWLIGKTAPDGGIIVNQALLGHELNHLLNFQVGEVQNPDTLEQKGL